jgi:hypothetical protein
MASSQAANLNLFLPILLHPQAATVLRSVKPDFAKLATSELDHGFRIEFKDTPHADPTGHTVIANADADLAIAYYNWQGELCLWLIEHKLTEKEFTTCGGYRSARGSARHNCRRSFAEVVRDPTLCYYHDVCGYNYWRVTAQNAGFFANHGQFAHCPFRGGMNQLWRNQLLALSVEQNREQPYRHASFSVVRHPGNHALDSSLQAYQKLIGGNAKFFVFTSADVLGAAAAVDDGVLNQWIAWYRSLYNTYDRRDDATNCRKSHRLCHPLDAPGRRIAAL